MIIFRTIFITGTNQVGSISDNNYEYEEISGIVDLSIFLVILLLA